MSKKNEICERHDILISKLIRSEGGIYKRIDENRELITTLIEECPELFEKNRGSTVGCFLRVFFLTIYSRQQ